MAATLSLFSTPAARKSRNTVPAVSEPQLFYDPPYATREEDAFAWALVRSLHADSGLRHAVMIGGTPYHFVIESEGKITAIELVDGDPATTQAPPMPERVDVRYRISRDDIRDRTNDSLYVMALLDPSLFDPHSRVKARRESSENLAIEFNGDRLSEITLCYEAPEPLVEIEGEWLVLDPDETVLTTRILRTERQA